MNVSEIKPFVRFARYMSLNKDSYYPLTAPCDSRLIYVKSGSAVIIADGVKYNMKRGDILIFKSGTPYKLCGAEASVTYIILNFDFTFSHSNISTPIPPKPIEEFTESDLIEKAEFSSGEFSSVLYLEKMERLEERLEKIKSEYISGYLLSEIKISGILTDILISCLRSDCNSETPEMQGQIEEILNYISAHCEEKITNTELGEKFGFHPNYISALVKQYTGIPMHQFLLRARLSRAAEELTETNLTIGQIAGRTGFCDIYYFSRYFKQYTKLTPAEYRKKYVMI